jgi:preprotein translocase subunit YajC
MSALHAKVTSIEGDRIVVELEDGQTLRLSKDACEGKATVGAEIRIIVTVPGAEDAGRQALARGLLNEILGA